MLNTHQLNDKVFNDCLRFEFCLAQGGWDDLVVQEPLYLLELGQ